MRGSSRLAGARLLCLLAFAVWSPCPAQVEQGARFLIIAADSFAPAAQTLADWRTATGQQAAVRTLSQTGASPTQVRTYIRNAWNTWPVKPEYVLLLCSPTQLPGYGYDNDCYYGDMTGDYLMEIPVGRIPAWNLSECRTMLAKTLAYEKLAGWSDSSWVLRGSTVIGEDNPGNPDTLYWPDCFYAHDRWTAHGYTRADSFYNLWGHTTSQLNSALNNGRSFMTYRGVG
ncbi:hypothetical protein FJY71_07515, partial [candidate division WOR-3 bacterium]|nr:hypothetical protein [candidate division WOR-3 bacterium]